MREILFRGQTRKYGEKVRMDGSPVESYWVYGCVFQGSGDFSIIYTGSDTENFKKFAVYSETVGQYTGLHDANGNMVFENDICRLKYADNLYVVHFSTQDVMFELLDLVNDIAIGFDEVYPDEIEIMGNQFDNPELMEVKYDDN